MTLYPLTQDSLTKESHTILPHKEVFRITIGVLAVVRNWNLDNKDIDFLWEKIHNKSELHHKTLSAFAKKGITNFTFFEKIYLATSKSLNINLQMNVDNNSGKDLQSFVEQ